MRPHIIFRYAGIVLLFNAAFLLISCVISGFNSDSAFFPLLYTALISALFGVFPLIFVPPAERITNKEGLTIVILSWLLSCLVGVVPYVMWGGEFSFTNAWFESVSGFTTTGSSIIDNIEILPLGLLFWRSATHWIGGIGIIIFVLAVLPHMGKPGMILYRTEMSSLAVNNFHYRSRKTMQILLFIYLGMTLAETISLLFCGIGLFDAVTHSFATIATGGFSPKNASIGSYKSAPVEIVVIVFMILSSIHFGLLFAALTGKTLELWKSSIVRYYLVALAAGVVAVTISVHGSQFHSWIDALRSAAFQVISLGTSTGFATTDSSIWPPFAQLVMIFFTLQCACAGSTSGGIKVDRIVLFWKAMLIRIKKMQHPALVIKLKINTVSFDDDVIDMNILFISFYLGIVFLSALILTALGVDMLSAFSGSAATMGNVGPGFGMVGSMSNFGQIPALGKWVLTATMLLGRLEIFGLILFLTVKSWK
ncbi:MAG: TrkH family potassium uptake protein [Deltaproteobacteria bacterium]|nr:TrkH family potassium uptake protein [Deltaproteobacteria bacterium]